MKFNPPPNWPRVPAGWTPPPGWQPDPSWPPAPPGWPLWVPDDEFVTGRQRSAVSPARSALPWYRRTVFVVLLLVIFFPIGLALLWLRNDWTVGRRTFVTAVVAVIVIIIGATSSPPPKATTASNPTTVNVLDSSSQASASAAASQAAASPSAASSSPSAPRTSAAPKTTAAAPVRTSAAPVQYSAAPVRTSAAPAPTTRAPQPVKTTTQKPSCYPLTDSGNCYKPGEYCRSSDHGATGIDAEGNPIKCEDNDGWRWESV